MKQSMVYRMVAVVGAVLVASGREPLSPEKIPVEKGIEALAAKSANYPKAQLLAELDQVASTNLQAFTRKALVELNPLLQVPVVFIVRNRYASDHHNTETLFQPGELNTAKYATHGVLKVLDVRTGITRVLFDPGPEGTVRDPEVSWDGRKIVFSCRRNKEDSYHIYVMNADGTGLRQLTAFPQVSDIDPVFLPDGNIVFSSTRDPKYCMCNRHIMCNLFRMGGDGSNIHQIGKSTLFEGHAEVLPDGRVIYDRWEYVDRNFGTAQALWVTNPDGTGHAIFYGNNTGGPGAKIQARPLPGSSSKVICTIAACHDLPWGGLAIIDRGKGVDGREPVLRTWPESLIDHIKIEGNYDAVKNLVRRKYQNPYPLSDDFFLAVCQNGGLDELVLIDVYGNQVSVHSEKPGCFDPVLLTARPAPQIRPVLRSYKKEPGLFYIQDVYIGTHLQGVERGMVKSLRIIESPEKRSYGPPGDSWYGRKTDHHSPGEQAPAINWSCLENKRILGTVPVEADGSAYFEVPANTFLYFQLLDAEGRMLQSMRSGTIVQPGETQGCIGCHENRTGDIPAVNTKVAAMRRAPSKLDGFHGPARLFDYQREIQPIFDKHCIRCHDYDRPGGQKLVLAGDRTFPFCRSYTALWVGKYTAALGAGRSDFIPAMTWGSRVSKLNQVIRSGHNGIRLSARELDILTAWEDVNAPYYGTYDSAYTGTRFGRTPLDKEELKTLEKLLGPVTDDSAPGAISLDRPEKSPALGKLKADAPEYAAALALLKTAQARLKAKPRGDMPGFKPDARYQAMLDKNTLLETEAERVRVALESGRKVYDPGIAP